MMAATEKFPTLLLNTSEGLLLQVGYAPLDFDWLAILRLPPSVKDEQAGIPGREVMRIRSIDPPRFLYHADDESPDVFVFIGPAMFSLPKSEAERLRANILLQADEAAQQSPGGAA